MTTVVQTGAFAVLATVVAGLLVYYLWQRRQMREAGEQLDQSYQSFYCALDRLVDTVKPEEREQPVDVSVQHLPHSQDVADRVALHDALWTESAARWPIGVGMMSGAFSEAAYTRSLRECPMCGNVMTHFGLADFASRRRGVSQIAMLGTYGAMTYGDHYSSEFPPDPGPHGNVPIVYSGGDYGEDVVYVDEGTYAGDRP